MLHLKKLDVIQNILIPQMGYRASNLLQIAELKLQVVDLVLVLFYVNNIIELLDSTRFSVVSTKW